MIAVHVGVHEQADAAVGNLLDRRDDLVAERRELRVDHQHAVGSRQHANRAALPLQRIEVPGDLRRLDLHLAEVRLLRVSVQRQRERHRET